MIRIPSFTVLALAASCAIAGCGNDDSAPSTPDNAAKAPAKTDTGAQQRGLDAIKASGELRVATRNAPTSYYIGHRKIAVGPEATLVKAFAAALGVAPKFVVENSIHGVLEALAHGKADLAAAGLTETPKRRERFAFGPQYQTIKQQVVCGGDGPKPEGAADLQDVGLTVIADSSYVERLETLKTKYPGLAWQTDDSASTETLLKRVWQNKLECTVADSNIVAINRRYYPSLKIRFDLGAPEHLAWAMPKGADALQKAADGWLAKYRERGDLAKTQARYYKFFPKFDYVENRALVRRLDDRYPKYDQYFESAARKHALAPVLLAAQGYQESHWDPDAKSPTGVRGIMMLTARTAKAIGVADRTDPQASIRGGAQYLADMQAKFSADADDRAYLALAAYNLGYAHIADAQRLAKRLGKDPNDWSDLRAVLPLLRQKRYYKTLKYGYARGSAPVTYVQRIRDYADIIRAHDPP